MPLPEAAVLHYQQQQVLTRQITDRARSIWSNLDTAELDASWGRTAEQMFVQLSTGQLLAASQADSYLDAVLAEQNINPARIASLNAKAFAGIASDGRDLESLLAESIIAAKAGIAQRVPLPDAMARGEASLVRIVTTQMQDAGRVAVGTAITARPHVTGWIRQINPPTCSRCAVLAGVVYRTNEGFERHPGCDCRHVPVAAGTSADVQSSPEAYFDSLSAAEQDQIFTQSGAQAIRDGADIRQVVNASRGMYRADGQQFTREGTTKRGNALTGARRPMPETIYTQARDRDEALALLKQHGYLR